MESNLFKYGELFQDGRGDYAYMSSSFYNVKNKLTPIDYLMNVNEYVVGLLMIFCNSFIVLVFVRILGIVRLVSAMIVSLAACNIIRGMAIIIHSMAVTKFVLSNSEVKCRLLYLIEITSDSLVWACLGCAVFERVITINIPSQVLASMSVIAPTLLSAPWVFCVYKITAGFILSNYIFEYDLGMSCSHHLMNMLVDDFFVIVPTITQITTVCLSLILIMSRVLHPPQFDDKWEANRLRLEYKTTSIYFQLLAPTYILLLPWAGSIIVMEYISNDKYTSLYAKHLCYQIKIYNGLILFFVLLARREFRKAFRFVFAKKEVICQYRQPNYLVAATESTRGKKSTTVVEASTSEAKAAVTVTAREDYKNLIAETDFTFLKKPAHKNPIGNSWFFDRSQRNSLE